MTLLGIPRHLLASKGRAKKQWKRKTSRKFSSKLREATDFELFDRQLPENVDRFMTYEARGKKYPSHSLKRGGKINAR